MKEEYIKRFKTELKLSERQLEQAAQTIRIKFWLMVG